MESMPESTSEEAEEEEEEEAAPALTAIDKAEKDNDGSQYFAASGAVGLSFEPLLLEREGRERRKG